jgi:acetolactate synthase-1/2/3 large subunit
MPGGGSNLDLLEAAGRAGLPFILTHTETAGALAASAQAELTGRPGACLATLGPGVASLVNGAAHASLDRTPVMLFTDGMPAAGRDIYQHQRLDHSALLRPVTKASFTLEADCAAEHMNRALDLATAGPPGPVHVDLAPDVSRQVTSPPTPLPFAAAQGSAPGEGNSTAMAPPLSHRACPERNEGERGLGGEVKELLSRSRRPIILAGLGIRDDADVAALRSLSETRGIPVLVTYKAKGVIPDADRWFGGVFTNGAIERPLVEQADLILGVGLDPIEFLPRPWAYKPPVVMCNRWPLEQRHVPVATTLVGDIPAMLHAVADALPRSSDWKAADVTTHARRQREALHLASPGWSPWRAVESAIGVADPDAQVTVDAGAHMFPITALWPARRPRQMLISNGLSTMGYARPAANGAALLDRTRRVLALTGDGGLLMCLAELATASREKLNVTVVVFNDRSLSLIRIKQERLGYPAAGVGLDNIDWQSAAKAFGVPAYRATGDGEMASALEQANRTSGPALVEAVVDPSGYGETLKAIRG